MSFPKNRSPVTAPNAWTPESCKSIYRFTDRRGPFYVGQQMDIFIEALPPTGFAADSAQPPRVFHAQGGRQP